MTEISDFQIFQNHLIGAHALWEFSKHYQDYEQSNQSPILLITLPVLPIVFNKRATDCIKTRAFKEGSLFKTIAENKDIYTGLQERMENSTELTFKSIHMAVSAGLILYDRDTSQLIANRRTEPKMTKREDNHDIIASSKRIGAWFGQLNIQEIIDYFNLQF